MVSLFELAQLNYSHLTSSLPSLDSALLSSDNRIYDFQAGAGVFGIYLVAIELIILHLSQGKPVVIVDTLNRFPYDVLKNHHRFKEVWNRQLISYNITSIVKLYTLVVLKQLPQNTIVILHNFHELLETYKNDLVNSYEEQIHKFQIDRNAVILQNEAGPKLQIPALPSNSDLLNLDPIIKFKTHVLALMNTLVTYTIEHKLIVVLLGHLEPKYNVEFDQTTGEVQRGKSVLGNSIDYSYGKVDVGKYISSRALFFKDWYMQKLVYVVQVNEERLYFAFRDGALVDVMAAPSRDILPGHIPLYTQSETQELPQHVPGGNQTIQDVQSATEGNQTIQDVQSATEGNQTIQDVSATEGNQTIQDVATGERNPLDMISQDILDIPDILHTPSDGTQDLPSDDVLNSGEDATLQGVPDILQDETQDPHSSQTFSILNIGVDTSTQTVSESEEEIPLL